MFLETSAETGECVDDVFIKCSRTILTKIDTGVIQPELVGNAIQVGTTAKKRTRRRRPGDELEVKEDNQPCCS